MKAVVTQAFPGRPDDEAASRTIKQYEIITGDLAQVAVENGWAEGVDDDFAWPVDENGQPITPVDEPPKARRKAK